MEISKICKSKIVPLNLKNTLKDAILKVLRIEYSVPIVDKKSLIGCLSDSDLLGIIYTRKYGISERIKNIDYIQFPISINKKEKIDKAIELIKNYNLNSLVVVNENNFPEYVLKDFELLKFIEVEGFVKDFMTKNPICTKIDNSENLIRMLVFSKFRNLPVIDKEKKFIGVLNVHRVLKSLYLNNFKIPNDIVLKIETFEKDDDIILVKKFLIEKKVAIIAEENKVIGIITPYDIIKKFHE